MGGMPDSVRSAGRVLGLFTAERPEWGPSSVARELGMAKSTAHALLAALGDAGLLQRGERGRYRLGFGTVRLARTALATDGRLARVVPAARRLARHFGETVHVAGRDGAGVVYLASERPRPAGAPVPNGPVPLSATPLGEVLAGEPGADHAVGPQRRLPGVTCAAARVDGDLAMGLCAASERFDRRGSDYVRGLLGVRDRLA